VVLQSHGETVMMMLPSNGDAEEIDAHTKSPRKINA